MRETTHVARPVRVYASQIVELTEQQDGMLRQQVVVARTADDAIHRLTIDMVARYKPVPGDYIVEQEDGYIYVNPRDVFERKYRPQSEQPLTFDQHSGAIEALRKLADQLEQDMDDPDLCAVVYGTLGEAVIVHTINSTVEAAGLLAIGQKVMGDVLMPAGGKML